MNDKNQKKNRIFKNFFYDFAMITGAIPGLIWLRPRHLYKSPKAKKRIRGGALVVSNHVSLLDPVYLMFAVWYRRQRFVCMDELMISPLARIFFKMARCIPINRDNISLNSFRDITDTLKNGEIVTIFPEGRINESSGTIEHFKSGVILMSIMSCKPIIPVYIAKPKRFFSGLCSVIGEPLDLISIYGRRPTGAQLGELAQLLHDEEIALMRIYEESKK